MNNLDKQYTDLLKTILEHGVDKKDRTGTGTKSIFGYTIRHNMKDGFPLLTTKKMPFKTIVTELLWFLRGDTNIKFLVDNNCHIWDGDAYKRYENSYAAWVANSSWSNNGEPWDNENFIRLIREDERFCSIFGELGPIYGKQWRSWRNPSFPKISKEFSDICDGRTHIEVDYPIDQIQNLINDLKTNPDSRRLMVNAWNVGEIDQMVLPPCHYGFQLYTRELSFDEFWDRLTPKQRGTMEKPYEGETYNGIDSRIEFKNFASEVHNLPTRAISLMWNQRSVDTFLGLPFNIASYGLLLEIIAKEVNMVPDELIGNLGDVHLYSNHIEQAKEQIGRELTLDERFELWTNKENESAMTTYNNFILDSTKHEFMSDRHQGSVPKRTRRPYPLPTFDCPAMDEIPHTTFDELVFKLQPCDFYMDDYQSHPAIKAPLSN